MPLLTESLEGFYAEVASAQPTPGGGSVAALCGSLAAALTAMVARLSRNQAQDSQVDLSPKLEALQAIGDKLLRAIDEDSASFEAVMAAWRLPKNSSEESALRHEAIQKALKHAATVPMTVAREANKIFDLARWLIESGNPHALTDVMVGVLAARVAVLGALLNVRINLQSIQDASWVQAVHEEVEFLEREAQRQESQLLELGYEALNQ